MRKYLILVSIVLFSACAGTKTTVTKTRTKVEALQVTDIVKLDTTIVIPKASATLKITRSTITEKLQEKKPVVFKQQKGRARVTVKIDSTGITATSNCDSIAKKLDYYKKTIKELRLEIKDTEVKEKVKKGYSLLELLLYITAVAIVSFVAGYLLKKFKII